MTVTFNLAAVCSRLQQACCANAHVHLSDNTHTHTHAQRRSLHACTVCEPKRDKQSEREDEEEEEEAPEQRVCGAPQPGHNYN